MDVAIGVLGSLAGVILGSMLTSWRQRKHDIRLILEQAIAAIAKVSASTSIEKTAFVDGEPDDHASLALRAMMIEQQQRSLVEARSMLAAVTPYLPEAAGLARNVALFQDPEAAQNAMARIRDAIPKVFG